MGNSPFSSDSYCRKMCYWANRVNVDPNLAKIAAISSVFAVNVHMRRTTFARVHPSSDVAKGAGDLGHK